MTGPEPERGPITALEMAQTAAAARGQQSAELAGHMALVSIAESLDKLVKLAIESEAER